MTFLDNKKRFSFTFFSGGPGVTRATVHSFFKTKKLEEGDKAKLREKVRSIIYYELQRE